MSFFALQSRLKNTYTIAIFHKLRYLISNIMFYFLYEKYYRVISTIWFLMGSFQNIKMHPISLYIWSITNVHCYKIKQSQKKTHRFEIMHVIFVTLTHIIGQDVNGLVKHTQVPNVIRVAMSAHTVVDLFWRQPIFLQALKTEK